jgi:hypothetical protein
MIERYISGKCDYKKEGMEQAISVGYRLTYIYGNPVIWSAAVDVDGDFKAFPSGTVSDLSGEVAEVEGVLRAIVEEDIQNLDISQLR